jgi:hypothetical protein
MHFQYLWYNNRACTCCKILWHGASSFTSHMKERVLWVFIALKSPSPRLSLNPQPLGSVTSTLTTTPLRQLVWRSAKFLAWPGRPHILVQYWMEMSGQLHTWVVYYQVKCPWYPLDIRLGKPQKQSGCTGYEKNLLPLLRIEPWLSNSQSDITLSELTCLERGMDSHNSNSHFGTSCTFWNADFILD